MTQNGQHYFLVYTSYVWRHDMLVNFGYTNNCRQAHLRIKMFYDNQVKFTYCFCFFYPHQWQEGIDKRAWAMEIWQQKWEGIEERKRDSNKGNQRGIWLIKRNIGCIVYLKINLYGIWKQRHLGGGCFKMRSNVVLLPQGHD